jgi:hypothetical protein
MRMSRKLPILLLAAAFVGLVATAQAEDTGNSALPTSNLKEQFEALSLDAAIVVRGEKLTKREFLTRNTNAAAAMKKKIEDAQAQAKAQFEAKRKALLDSEQAKLDDANKKARAAAKKLLAEATAGHTPDYSARIQQATALLERAKTAQPEEAAQIESQAKELLKIIDPEAAKKLAQ